MPTKSVIATPLGEMHVFSDDKTLYFTGFADQKHYQRHSQLIQQHVGKLQVGKTTLSEKLSQLLLSYFKKQRVDFDLPLTYIGTDFQKHTWSQLQRLRHEQTSTYASIANAMGKPTAFRAVANAVGLNPFSIIVPCHRVIRSDGTLGGYAGGLDRKIALLTIEKGMNYVA
jgi:O-6-methylguanine DNA methyltransferase